MLSHCDPKNLRARVFNHGCLCIGPGEKDRPKWYTAGRPIPAGYAIIGINGARYLHGLGFVSRLHLAMLEKECAKVKARLMRRLK